jgi:hypothetical protein
LNAQIQYNLGEFIMMAEMHGIVHTLTKIGALGPKSQDASKLLWSLFGPKSESSEAGPAFHVTAVHPT